MNKLLLFLLPLILGGCALTSPKLPQITTADKDKNFDFPVNQQFQIVLPSNQTTGYQWQVDDITTSALETINNEYLVTDKYKENIVGAGGEEIWTFKVSQVKRSHIVMKYLRPWDKSDVANDFLVTINGNPGDDGLLTYAGMVVSAPQGSNFTDYFKASTGEEFGVTPITRDQIADPGVKTRLAEMKDKSTQVEIRGKFIDPTADAKTKTFIISEITVK